MHIIEKLKSKAKGLKDEIKVLVIAYRDKRTPLAAKILVGITVGYLLSPIDLIPDFIPVLGLLDDLLIVPLLIRLSLRLIPSQVLIDARQKVEMNSGQPTRNNYLFAAIIITLWLTVVLVLLRIWITMA